ncbi:MAG TPA: hypothetical protein VGV12_00530 [Gemmatimonadales bacterium]|nr:hypothetical protein [Gemmatimonadales bacterium]
MHGDARVRIAAVLGGTCLMLAACGTGQRRQAAVATPPPDVVKPLEVPPSPYYIIYSPPVSLAKPPDTTAHARKGRD